MYSACSVLYSHRTWIKRKTTNAKVKPFKGKQGCSVESTRLSYPAPASDGVPRRQKLSPPLVETNKQTNKNENEPTNQPTNKQTNKQINKQKVPNCKWEPSDICRNSLDLYLLTTMFTDGAEHVYFTIEAATNTTLMASVIRKVGWRGRGGGSFFFWGAWVRIGKGTQFTKCPHIAVKPITGNAGRAWCCFAGWMDPANFSTNTDDVYREWATETQWSARAALHGETWNSRYHHHVSVRTKHYFTYCSASLFLQKEFRKRHDTNEG